MRPLHFALTLNLVLLTSSANAAEKLPVPNNDASKVDALRMAQTNLLEEIKQLKNENRNLAANNAALKTLHEEQTAVERSVRKMNLSDARPSDCADLLMLGVRQSGEYYIYPFSVARCNSCGCEPPIKVYCDMVTDGGGWTVIMSRKKQKNQLDFNKTWDEYKEGFGGVTEQWLGLENMHKMTYSRTYSLRMDIDKVDGDSKFLVYPTFQVDDEDNRYKLDLGGRSQESTNEFDCLYHNRKRYFTTHDKDFDNNKSDNCAILAGGGFWYYDCRTHFPPTGEFNNSMNLSCYGDKVYEVARLQMKIRPTICQSTYKRINIFNAACTACDTVIEQ
ncbi:microfibril-associated glycoprotein 4-like [Palaemon carinicauda]|uniref:microfibril-associated glycoprotein 4-like n=1 Tax=Palaemon carinicauda TaxID=392227 RepID=UPI0035B5F107